MFWLYFNRAGSRLQLLSIAWLSFCVTLSVYFIAPWDNVGFVYRYLMMAIFAVILIASLYKKRGLPIWPVQKSWKTYIGLLLIYMLGLYFIQAVPSFFTARKYPQPAVEMTFPLKGGAFQIGHGGSNESANYHYAYKAQKYALDIVQVDPKNGRKWNKLFSHDNSDYYIYGTTIVSPCDGEVIFLKDELPDAVPFEIPNNAENAAGNNIVIYCKDVSVTLAHIKAGSFRVKIGDQLSSGQEIAQVGNSGNTSEPHLHIHAVKGKTTDSKDLLYEAEGVPVVYDGLFPVRGDVIAK